MNVRIETTENFYETAVKWWKLHNFPILHKSILPEKVFVASVDGIDVHGMFVYETNSALLYLAYPISNKKFEYEKRKNAFNMVLSEIEIWAKKNNYFLLYTTSPIEKVHNTLKASDFVIGDELVTQFFKPINYN